MRARLKGFVVALLAGTLAACGQSGYFRAYPPAPPPAQMRPGTVADSIAFAPYLLRGTATITGQAFLMTRGGEAKKAAGRVVLLDPAVEYTRDWIGIVANDLTRYSEDPGYFEFQKARMTTTADADGRFKFEHLAPGPYYITTAVTWSTGSVYDGVQGGVIRVLATAKAGQTVDVVVTR